MKLHSLAVAISLTLWAQATWAQSNDTASEDEELESVVVTGTRVAGRSATETAVPVDTIAPEQLQRGGVTEVNQALSVALPSFNFPRPGLADGTDTIRPATLRGLAPDQTLVLVNSKRRHSASLVNVNGTVGRGSSAVDLNTIPAAAVQGVEVLRDGASAQYGSDAIAGVINVLLRSDTEGGEFSLSYGQRESTYGAPVTPAPANANWPAPTSFERDVSDGETITLNGWMGFSLGESGYLTLSTELKDQQRTERDGYDFRQQYPLVNGAFDPREATIDRFNAWYGEPDLKQGTLFANFGIDGEGGARHYGWASYQSREARSAGFFRRALDTRNIIEIYPNGFLPIIAPDVTDFSAAYGYQWFSEDWMFDGSLVYGKNKMEFTIENTLNASIGPSSKTEFFAGGFDYDQLVFNFSATRPFDFGNFASPVNLSTGVEARREGYSIFEGEPDSYRFGGRLIGTTPAQAGAQVFPGFRPANEVDEHRTAVGAYLDLEANVTEQFLASLALRAEHYSDFGNNLSGKLAGRFDATENFAIRGSLQNGFRAPSLQQQFFTATSTNFINGVPFDITTFPVNDPAAIALGAQELDAEESTNFSLGLVMQASVVNITVDAYRIKVDDRIVLSENLTQNNVRDFLQARGFVGIGGGRFFINGVDTTTKGVDVVINFPVETDTVGQFDFTVLGNVNDTNVTRIPTTNVLSSLNPAPDLFARVNVLTFEEGTPSHKIGANVNWEWERFGATLRATKYGSVLDPGTTEAFDVSLGSEVVVDLETRVQFNDMFSMAVGADNVFDRYPDAFPNSRNTTGNTPYSQYAPFGRSGRFLFARLTASF
jgi:iron complex outermembrane receptor protein